MEAAAKLVDRQLSLYQEPEDEAVDPVLSSNLRAPWLLSLLDTLLLFDEQYRLLVFGGEMEASQDLEAWLHAGLKRWAGLADLWLQGARQLAANGATINRIGDVAQAQRQVRSILTADDDYFASDALVTARDQALDEHARGETEPLEAS